MTIKAILNGYYRSGTTILWWIMRLSNLDKPVLYEPTSPILLDHLREWKYGQINGLHNLPIFDGYFMLDNACLEDFKRNQRGEDVYLSPGDAFRTLDPLHRCSQDMIIKSCQLHFILNEVAERYGCNYIHVIRHPAEVFVSSLRKEYRNDKTLKAIYDCRLIDDEIDSAFWLSSIYEKASSKLGLHVRNNDYVGKFIIAWTFCNLEAVKQARKSKRGKILYFEQIALNPSRNFIEIAEHLGIKMHEAYAGLLNPNRVYQAPEWFRKAIWDKIGKLGLIDEVGKILVRGYEA